MSTILGLFQRDSAAARIEKAAPMLAATRSRAIDGEHVWQEGPLLLAHQHFWVTPEEQGEEQPIHSASGRSVIAFDGRLDNRVELIATLELDDFAGWSDAAIVVEAYERWGEQCAAALLGDFAFIVWDRLEQRLFCVRDALGTRGLCFYINEHFCLVASTITAILAHPDVSPRLNDGAIAEYLALYQDNQRETFYEGIEFCPPAHSISVTSDGYNLQRYWHPPADRKIRYKAEQDYADEFYDLFTQAVQDRTRCTGRVGVTVSGGMDSTSVSVTLRDALQASCRLPGTGLRSYSLVYDAFPRCDEREYIQSVVATGGFDPTYIRADDAPILTGSPPPFFSPALMDYLATNNHLWLMLEQARQDGCQVLFTGHYGDKLYYRQYFWPFDMIAEGRWTTLGSTFMEMRRADKLRRIRSFGRELRGAWNHKRHSGGLSKNAANELYEACGIQDDLVRRANLLDRIEQDQNSQLYADHAKHEHAKVMVGDGYIRSSPQILDGSQRLGIELVDPFRDRRLAEYVMAIPSDILGRPGSRAHSKYVLRLAMTGRLPDSVRLRKRKTFFDSWVLERFWKHEWPSLRRMMEDEPRVVANGYVRQAWLGERMAAQTASPQLDRYLFRVLCLELWLGLFGRSELPVLDEAF